MFKHILAATDGTARSSEAVTLAARLARALGAKLTVVNAREPFLPMYPDWGGGYAPMIAQDDFDRAVKAGSEEILAGAKRLAAVEKVECQTVSVASDLPWRAILDCAADQGCDAIVMASHGRKGIEGMMLGSETHKVLIHSSLPVLVTRSSP